MVEVRVVKEEWEREDFRGDPTIAGVPAREPPPPRDCESGSANMVSRKDEAQTMDASEVSEACSEASRSGETFGSTRLEPRLRNSTSSASCVRPLCDFDPRIVCD